MNPIFPNWERAVSVFASILIAGLGLGCSGRVNLGDAATGAPPEPTTSEVEIAAQTTNLAQLAATVVSGLAADESYLYLMTLSDQTGSYSLQRCKKSDCWRSLTSIASVDWSATEIQLNAGQLTWTNVDGLQLCHAPDCQDVQVVPGVTFEDEFVTPYVWDQEYVYWFLKQDSAIYRCNLPRCQAGPELVASSAQVLDMALVGDQVYWLDETYGILRTATNGTAQPEQLTLGEQTAWVQFNPDVPATAGSSLIGMTIEGPFIYARLPACEPSTNGESNDLASSACLVRWRYAEVGAPRELLLTGDASVDTAIILRVLDGEVVWGSSNGYLWSCLADNCAATKRQFGVDGNVDFNFSITADEQYHPSIAADEQYLYWLSSQCDLGPANLTGTCNLKRTPRIAQ